MGQLSAFFFNRVNIWWALIASGITTIYLLLAIKPPSAALMEQIPEGLNIPDLWFGMNLEKANLFFGSLNEAGFDTYQNMLLTWDNIYPLLYCTVFAFWISLIYRRNETAHRFVLNTVPIVLLIFDWVENFLELQLMNQFRFADGIDPQLVKFTSIVNMGKWAFFAINGLIVIVGLVLLLVNKIKR